MESTPSRPYTEPLRFAVMEITNRCNLRCPHCASNSGEPRSDEFTKAQWFDVVDDLAKLGCEEVTLLGGEVFLYPDWLDVARRINDRNIQLTIVTNGLMVTDRIVENLKTLDLNRLGVSLDAATPEIFKAVRGVDGFARVWSTLTRLRDLSLCPVNAITTVSKVNFGELRHLAAVLKGTGITWQVQIASSVARRFRKEFFITPDQYIELCLLLSELIVQAGEKSWVAAMDDFGYFPLDPTFAGLHEEWSGCQGGISVLGIRANGDVLGCLSMGDEMVAANLRDRSLVDVWTSPDVFRTLREKGASLTGVCKACPMAEQCRAGCTNMALSATGSIYENTYCLRHLECSRLLSEMDL